MAPFALWSFFGLFTGVWKIGAVLATIAVVGWRAGWWQRLGLARRVLTWARVNGADLGTTSTSRPATSRKWRFDWRLLAALFVLAWLVAWVILPRTFFPRSAATSRSPDPGSPESTTPSPDAERSRPPFPGGLPQ